MYNPSGYFAQQQRNIGAGGAVGSDEETAKLNKLYNYEEPQQAFDNFLRQTGYNPNVANPFVQTLRGMAPGFGNSFLMARATNPGNTAADQLTSGADYANYMQGLFNPSALPDQAAGQPSQFYATLRDAAGYMPQAVQAVRNFNPQDVNHINPYTQALAQNMAAQGGQGTTDLLRSFYQPFMGRATGSAYSNALDMAQSNANRNYWMNTQGGGLLHGDIYNYLLGY